MQERFKDSDKKAAPEDWASLFSQSISTDAVPSDSFDSECGPLSTVQKSGLTQMAFLMAVVWHCLGSETKHTIMTKLQMVEDTCWWKKLPLSSGWVQFKHWDCHGLACGLCNRIVTTSCTEER